MHMLGFFTKICEFVFFRNSSVHSTYKCVIQMMSLFKSTIHQCQCLVFVVVLILKKLASTDLEGLDFSDLSIKG